MTTHEEYEAEARNEFFNDWLEDNRQWVEEDYWETVPADEMPLDDDMPDYLADHYDDFMEVAREQFKYWLEEERVRWN